MMKQLSGLDAMFLYLEKPWAPLEVSSLHIYDRSTAPGGQVSFEDVLDCYRSRLNRSVMFRRKLAEVPLGLDHPYWVNDDDFDLEYHVRHIALPKPGDWRQLMIQVSRLQSQSLDKSRPLWEAYMIDGLDHVEGFKPGCFALFMKMHHASVDGVSGVELQKALHDLEPIAVDHDAAVHENVRVLGAQPSPWSLLAKTPGNYLSNSIRLVKSLVNTAPKLVAAARSKEKQSTAKEAPATLFNLGRVTPNRAVDSRSFDLQEMKEITQAIPGSKINDVVLSIVSGAMRRYLLAKGHLPATSLIAGCPVNVRLHSDVKGEHDNLVSIMNAPLHTEIEDPIARIHAIHAGTLKAKAALEQVGAETMTVLPMTLPAPLIRYLAPALIDLLGNTGTVPFNTMITNVPGIQQPIYLAGAEMVSLLGMGPVVDKIGLFHTAFSYNGKISITVTACRDMMPDPAFYADCIGAAYQELRLLTLGESVNAKPLKKVAVAEKETVVEKAGKKPAAKRKTALKKVVAAKSVTNKKLPLKSKIVKPSNKAEQKISKPARRARRKAPTQIKNRSAAET